VGCIYSVAISEFIFYFLLISTEYGLKPLLQRKFRIAD
jgi:hypothetical protein